MLIDDLSSRRCGRARNISEIKVKNEPITSAVEMAEVLNDYFATIGSNLASEIQPSYHIISYIFIYPRIFRVAWCS